MVFEEVKAVHLCGDVPVLQSVSKVRQRA